MSNISGGVYTGTDFADKVFYGFRLNNQMGELIVDAIDDDSLVISTGEPDVIDPEAYKAFMWSADSYDFRFDQKGHLLLAIL